MKKSCRVLFVCLALIGATSRGFGEWPPLLAESTTPPSVSAAANSTRPALLTGASRVAQTVAVPALPARDARKLDCGKLERKLAVMYPNSKVYLIPMGFKTIVRGQAHDSEEAAHILKVVRGEVANQIAASADLQSYLKHCFGSSGDGRAYGISEWDLVSGLIINELHIPGPKQDDGVIHHEVGVGWLEAITASPSPRWLPPLHHNFRYGDLRSTPPMLVHSGSLASAASIGVSPRVASLLSSLPTAPNRESQPPSLAEVDPFQFHLRSSEAHLRQAGLIDAANQLQAMHQSYLAQHQGTLLIARKEAQLKSLQTEIARLKQTGDSSATQVSLRIRLVEIVSDAKARESIHLLFNSSPNVTSTMARPAAIGSSSDIFESAEIQPLLDHLLKTGDVKVISEPQMTVLSGRQGKFLSGGEIAVPSVVGVGGPHEVSYRPFGTSIEVCPLVAGDRIRLSVNAEYTRQEDVVQQASNQATHSRRLTMTAEMRPGQTLVLAGLKTPQSRPTQASQSEGKVTEVGSFVDDLAKSNSDAADLLIVITPEIVTPLERQEAPPVPGFEVTRPVQLPAAPVPARE